MGHAEPAAVEHVLERLRKGVWQSSQSPGRQIAAEEAGHEFDEYAEPELAGPVDAVGEQRWLILETGRE